MAEKWYVFAVNRVSRFDRLVGVYRSREAAEEVAKLYNSDLTYSRYCRYDVRESLNG